MSKNGNFKNSMFYKKVKTSINNQKQYKIFESKQFIGIILIVVFAFFFVTSIVQVRGLSTINSYTIGMLFGYYSYFIYVGFILLGLCFLFQIDIKIEKLLAIKFNKKFYFSWISYLFFSLGVALVAESIIKIVHTKTAFPGSSAFEDFFSSWWNSFTNSRGKEPGSTSWLPNIMNSGIIVSLFMSLLVSWSGYVISIIIGLLFVAYFFYYIFYGSLIKKIKTHMFENVNNKNKVKKDELNEHKTKIMDLSFEDSFSLGTNSINNEQTIVLTSDESKIFDIDNPLEQNESEREMDFVQEKTSALSLEKNITTEFKFDDLDKTKKQPFDQETFNFELDIFKTSETNIDDLGISKSDVNNKNESKKDENTFELDLGDE